jgi:hypothetical protein
MRHFKILKNAGLSVSACIATVLCLLMAATPAQAVTPADADLAFSSLNKVYWDPASKSFRKEAQGPKRADFWFAAQLWETVMDQYDRTKDADVKRQINEVYDGFVKQYADWTTN